MLTLNEIRNVNFRKANFGGYRAEDVEAFIDEVQLSYDTLLRENAELVKKLEVLAAKIDQYQTEEDSIRNALMNAQKVGDASLRDAKHKAEIILKDATIKAEKIVSNAQTEIHREREIIDRMQRDIGDFKAKLLRAYKEHISLINNIPTEDIMRPETKEMMDSVPMLDRRATAPSYDVPSQYAAAAPVAAPVPTVVPQQNPPSPARRFGETGTGYPESAAEAPNPFARSTSKNMNSQSRQMATQLPPQPAAQPVMPNGERPSQRRGGFTVDIDDQPGAFPAASNTPPQRRESRFGASYTDEVAAPENTAQFSGVKLDENQAQTQGSEEGFAASLFKRRGR